MALSNVGAVAPEYMINKRGFQERQCGLRIDLKGELAGILVFSDAGKKKPGAASGVELLEQIKMVARTRKQRESIVVPVEL